MKGLRTTSLLLSMCTFVWSFSAYAVEQINVVYRIDDRPMSQIVTDGMRPWVDGISDDDLSHHFDGESIEGHVSNFVSTSMSIRGAIDHAAALARVNSNEPYDPDFQTFIWEIRPADNFYPLEASFQAAMAASDPSSQRYTRIADLLSAYGGMEEMDAHGGFAADRIIRYAVVNTAMIEQYYDSGQMYSPMFWESRWQTDGTVYNPQYDNDLSSSVVWDIVGTPRGYTDVVQNGNLPPVPLNATCLAVHYASEIDNESNSGNANVTDSECPDHEHLNVVRQFYDPNLLGALLD